MRLVGRIQAQRKGVPLPLGLEPVLARSTRRLTSYLMPSALIDSNTR